MSMDKSIVGYIVSSLEAWRENEKVGEEIRAMKGAIEEVLINDIEPALEVIFELIEKFEDDKELGTELRKLYIPLKIYYEDKTITL
jgi:hypothetical protein